MCRKVHYGPHTGFNLKVSFRKILSIILKCINLLTAGVLIQICEAYMTGLSKYFH